MVRCSLIVVLLVAFAATAHASPQRAALSIGVTVIDGCHVTSTDTVALRCSAGTQPRVTTRLEPTPTPPTPRPAPRTSETHILVTTITF